MNDEPKLIPIVKKPRPKEATTMFEMSQNSVGTDNNSHAYLVGSGGIPPLPPSPWEADINNLEPPLNEEISAVQQMLTTPHGGNVNLPPVEDEAPTDVEDEQ